MVRLGVMAGGLALLVGCEPEFWGDLGEIGFATDLVDWTPAHAIARGAPVRIGVAGTTREGEWTFDGRVTGDLDAVDEDQALTVSGDRGRVHFVGHRADGARIEDRFPLRFEDPSSVRANGEQRLAIVAGEACPLSLTVHDRRGATLGHAAEALDVAGDDVLQTWATDTERIEVVAEVGVGRLEVAYGDFGALRGPEIVGVPADALVTVELVATVLSGTDTPVTMLQPRAFTADGTGVTCVPVVWDLPAGLEVERVPGTDGGVVAVFVAGRGLPDGVGVHLDPR